MAQCKVSKIRKLSNRSAISEIILYIFLKTNIEGELISEKGNKFLYLISLKVLLVIKIMCVKWGTLTDICQLV